MGEDVMPIHSETRREMARENLRCPRVLPMAWFTTPEAQRQAQTNHDQTPERLAQRGGLCVTEAVAILQGQRWPGDLGPRSSPLRRATLANAAGWLLAKLGAEATLKEVLRALGYTTDRREDPRWGGRTVYQDGVKVWEGSADACWTWLRDTGQL